MTRKSRPSKEVIKGPWSAQEDEVLANYINLHGEGKWRDLPQKAGLNRCGKSCRLRWLNYLKPGVKRGKMSADEEDLIIRMHKLIGNRWSLIAGRLPGRTDNEIKNYWNTSLSKKLYGTSISRGQKRKLEHDQTLETTASDPSKKSAENVSSETLPPPSLVHQVLDSAGGLVVSDCVDENILGGSSTDRNGSTNQKPKKVSEDNNVVVQNASNATNCVDYMSFDYLDFPISTPPEVATKSMIVDSWDWSIFSDPWLLNGEWDLHTVDTFVSSEHNWSF